MCGLQAGDLSAKDKEHCQFAFSIYDFEGNGQIDAFNLGDCLRALGLKPSNKVIESHGGTKKKGEKKLKLADFLPVFAAVKKDKDIGNFHDFMELFKLYDKETNGMMIVAELTHLPHGLQEVEIGRASCRERV